MTLQLSVCMQLSLGIGVALLMATLTRAQLGAQGERKGKDQNMFQLT